MLHVQDAAQALHLAEDQALQRFGFLRGGGLAGDAVAIHIHVQRYVRPHLRQGDIAVGMGFVGIQVGVYAGLGLVDHDLELRDVTEEIRQRDRDFNAVQIVYMVIPVAGLALLKVFHRRPVQRREHHEGLLRRRILTKGFVGIFPGAQVDFRVAFEGQRGIQVGGRALVR